MVRLGYEGRFHCGSLQNKRKDRQAGEDKLINQKIKDMFESKVKKKKNT